MTKLFGFAMFFVCFIVGSEAQSSASQERIQAEYYVSTYATHYGLPVVFVRAVVQRESGWRSCAISSKGAVGLMQLMPLTAARMGVRNRCDLNANISAGVRYLTWLCRKFNGDLRLVAAAYLAGEQVIARRGLLYGNPEVVAYVSRIRKLYSLELKDSMIAGHSAVERNVR